MTVLRPESPIVERPISFSPARLKATADYIKTHAGEDRPDGRITPRMVVLHWTGSDSLESDFKTFDKETLAGGRPDISAGGDLNVSAHFLVGKDGRIYRLMPENVMARHVIGLNLEAIGVENVGGVGDRPTLTAAQAATNAWLVRELKERHPAIEYLIGHHEYRKFEGSALWKEKDAGYRTAKSDPGDKFMADVRRRVADLGLKSAP
ncbi:N-acetylmuramoyl-L-alanine amidase [bacterium]|nr:MAG: N-acetylmuramoyl-L-alanine amidase [bacterium]